MSRSLLLLLIATLLCRPTWAAKPEVRVMSFNIRYGSANDGANHWNLRRQLVCDEIERFDPELLGLQEALDFQLDFISQQIGGYELVGVGRDDGQRAGEHAAFFVSRDRFEVIESGVAWLSDTPATPGSLTWGGQHPRIYTWACLADRRTGHQFYAINTHWDHQSQESRTKSAQAISAWIARRDGGASSAVLLGDLNAGPENPAVKRLQDDPPGLVDAHTGHGPDAFTRSTFHGFKGEARGPAIDWILVGRRWRVKSAGVSAEIDGPPWRSDHLPVWAVISLAP